MFRLPVFAFSKRFQAISSPSSVLPDGKLGGDNQTSHWKLFSHCPLANLGKKRATNEFRLALSYSRDGS